MQQLTDILLYVSESFEMNVEIAITQNCDSDIAVAFGVYERF